MITDSHYSHYKPREKHQGWTKFTAQNCVGSANQLPALKDGGKPKMPKLLLNILNCTIITRPHVKRNTQTGGNRVKHLTAEETN